MFTKEQIDQATPEQLAVMLAQAQQENEQLKAEHTKTKREQRITLKVSEKGGLSAYGFGRFPVTLYKGQWIKLLSIAKDIEAFIKANDKYLAQAKGQAPVEKVPSNVVPMPTKEEVA